MRGRKDNKSTIQACEYAGHGQTVNTAVIVTFAFFLSKEAQKDVELGRQQLSLAKIDWNTASQVEEHQEMY